MIGVFNSFFYQDCKHAYIPSSDLLDAYKIALTTSNQRLFRTLYFTVKRAYTRLRAACHGSTVPVPASLAGQNFVHGTIYFNLLIQLVDTQKTDLYIHFKYNLLTWHYLRRNLIKSAAIFTSRSYIIKFSFLYLKALVIVCYHVS